MRKIVTLIAMLLIGCYTVYSQDEITFTGGIEDDSTPDSIVWGNNGPFTVQVLMELTGDELLFDDDTKKRPDSVKQVQIYIHPNYRSTITSFTILVASGTDIASASPITSQSIDVSELTDGWNTFDFSTFAEIDPSKSMCIGADLTFNGSYLPVGLVEGTNRKQGWMIYNGNVISLTNNATRMLMIKTVASLDNAFDNEISLLPWSKYSVMGDSVQITIKNIGKDTLTSFDLSYTVNTEVTENISGINVASGETHSFTLDEFPVFEDAKKYNLEVTISNPNGENDLEINNTYSSSIYSLASNTTQRVVLHEGFSSSTCGPCNYGNVVLKEILAEAEEGTSVSVKYQCNFPGNGDPYYTSEIGTRMSYYSVNSVPTLVVDGPDNFRDASYYYRKDILKDLASVPAFAKIDGEVEVDTVEKSVGFNAEIKPLFTSNSNIRFFAVIVEKWTNKNVKSNGETQFVNVVKKFLTSPSGNALTKFNIDSVYTIALDYTFNGEYRLPANAKKPIDLSTEHSVEDFKRLKVVYWIQDNNTKEVYQAGEVDPFPGVVVGIPNVDAPVFSTNMNIYPNPAKGDVVSISIDSKEPVKGQISVYDVVGNEVLRLPQEVYSSNQTVSVKISNLSSGIYFIRLNTAEGSTTKKLIVTK